MHGLLAVAGEALEEGAAGGVGEGLEEIVRDGWHERTITNWLWIVNEKSAASERHRGQGIVRCLSWRFAIGPAKA
jgi:hypothetical protein